MASRSGLLGSGPLRFSVAWWLGLIWALIGLACSVPEGAEPGSPDQTSVPRSHAEDPTFERLAGEILGYLDEAPLLCLGESHGSQLDARLRSALVRHPRFSAAVELVVVEFANPIHQALLDRWILGGETLPREVLRPIWLDAGLGRVWDLPIYEAFLRQIAELNRRRVPAQRIRVLGAALPIPWGEIESAVQLDLWLEGRLDRQGHFEEVLRREVLEPGRRTLAVFGSGHCELKGPSMLSRLDAERVRSVYALEGEKGRVAARRNFDLGGEARLLRIRGEVATRPAGEMLFEGHGYAGSRLGELAHGLVYFGELKDLELSQAKLEPDMEAELDRRARLWQLVTAP